MNHQAQHPPKYVKNSQFKIPHRTIYLLSDAVITDQLYIRSGLDLASHFHFLALVRHV
jgi:hypothetical protein